MSRIGVASQCRVATCSIVQLIVVILFVSGCSSSSWTRLELGDVFDVRGRQLVMRGDAELSGSVAWGLALKVPPQRAHIEVQHARVGVGSAARWTLHADPASGVPWPTHLEVMSAVWNVEIQTVASTRRQRFDLPARQRLSRSLPCDASSCSYTFVERDVHRDVFTLEAVAGDYEAVDSLLTELQLGLEALVWLSLFVEVHPLDAALPPGAQITVPLAPSGASVAYRP